MPTELKEIKTPFLKPKGKIQTIYDRVFDLVRERKVASGRQIKKALGINEKTLNQCIDVLEASGLVEVSYPPVGDVKLKLALSEEEKDLLEKERKKTKPVSKKEGRKPSVLQAWLKKPGASLLEEIEETVISAKEAALKPRPGKKIKLQKPLVKTKKKAKKAKKKTKKKKTKKKTKKKAKEKKKKSK